MSDLSINDLSKNFFLNTKSNFIKEDYKRLRKNNAIQLPPEIKQEMIPKYVVYYKECYNKEKKLYRDFFKIEKHPLIINKKIYVSSKSNKVTIIEKLVRSGINHDSKCLGANYVLCALTLVSSDAATAIPWLFQSVF